MASDGNNEVFSSGLTAFKNVVIETPIPAFGTKVISVISVVTPVLLALIVTRPANAVHTLTFPYSVNITFSGSEPS